MVEKKKKSPIDKKKSRPHLVMMLTSGSSKQSTNTGFLSRNLENFIFHEFLKSKPIREMDLALEIPSEDGKGYFGVEGGIRDQTISRLVR